MATATTHDAGDAPHTAPHGKYTGYHPVILAAAPPSLAAGYAVLAASAALLAVGSYATLLSAVWPHTGIRVLDALAADSHYKYFVLLLIPTTAYFVIANWVGWQYYRNS
ncbi:PYG-Y domain-containing protein [Phanerochaete sordida]|uniref:PYG-Y domain-containing protein n=1 Tax=Phanerochaete sordida TaxID=48140 RepID=A0A9P3LKD2_9APHY|nr:PYG-Y domain-containing protein [Phanerochaete sordida]